MQGEGEATVKVVAILMAKGVPQGAKEEEQDEELNVSDRREAR